MPRKKSAAKKDVPNKSAFIRQHGSLKAAEVVAKGKEAGLTFGVDYVYSIRAQKKSGAKKKMGRPAGSKNKSNGTVSHNLHPDNHGHAKAIRAAIVHLGAHAVHDLVTSITKQLGG